MARFIWSFQEAEIIALVLFSQPSGWKRNEQSVEQVFDVVRAALQEKGYSVPGFREPSARVDYHGRDWDRCEMPGKLLVLLRDFFPDDGSRRLFYPEHPKGKSRLSTGFRYGYDKAKKVFELSTPRILSTSTSGSEYVPCRRPVSWERLFNSKSRAAPTAGTAKLASGTPIEVGLGWYQKEETRCHNVTHSTPQREQKSHVSCSQSSFFDVVLNPICK